MEVLCGCFPPALWHALEELPKSLDTTYEWILLGIETAKRGYAYCVLQCLAISICPLLVKELAEVFAFRVDKGEDTKYDCNWCPEDARQAVFSACSGLIIIVDVDGVPAVQFSHFSVKEFLMSSHLANAAEHLSLYHIIPSSHAFLARSCLGVLLTLGDDIDKSLVEKRPFAIYAAQYWVDHTKFESVSLGIQEFRKRLFDSDAPYFATWVWIYDIDCPWKGFMPTVRPTEPEAKPLYYAALCGFCSLVEHLIVIHQIDVNSRDGDHGTAINAALSKGDSELKIAQILLQNGTNVNIVDSGGIGSLYRAVQACHGSVLEFLLKYQADVHLRIGPRHMTALHEVAWAGELDICGLLLKHGADVMSKARDGWTPLHFVSCHGHFVIVQELLVHNANVNDQKEDLWTPLHLASAEHLNIVQLLVQSGAVLDKLNADRETALHLVSHFGNLKIACFLIENGTNTMSTDNESYTNAQSVTMWPSRPCGAICRSWCGYQLPNCRREDSASPCIRTRVP